MYAQLIDDVTRRNNRCASTLDKELAEQVGNGGNVEAARKVGALIAERAKEKGVRQSCI